MRNVLITGISGYVGSTVHKELSDHPEVNSIVGIDINAPGFHSEKSVFYQQDIREPIIDILDNHRIDTVIHAAYVLPPLHDKSLMEDININGTKNVLKACESSKVTRLLYTSSATAYGFHPDNPVPLKEEHALRGNDNFIYAKNKKEIEQLFIQFIKNNPNTETTILRPCFVIGPGIQNPISRYLVKPLVVMPSKTSNVQFVHEKDLCRAILLCLNNRLVGAYNIAGAGTIGFREMVTFLGGKILPLPLKAVHIFNQLAWVMRLKFLTEMPSSALAMIVHPWIVSSEKFITATGFKFEYSSKEAFLDFKRHHLEP